MDSLSSFPHITLSEFSSACNQLSKLFETHRSLQTTWLSLNIIHPPETDTPYLKITKPLSTPSSLDPITESEDDEITEEDDNALAHSTTGQQVAIEYDIIHSPSYQVPVLYINIRDPLFRYPPTMETLYQHIIPADFKQQTENVGVIGGITITDHPIRNTPVFFIHPCQMAAVLEASLPRPIASSEGKMEVAISPSEYLILWIGAMGKCVGLDVPLEIAAAAK